MKSISENEYIDAAKTVLKIEINELKRLSDRIDASFVDAVRTLRETIDAQRKIIVIGVGKSENIAIKIAATLNSTGASAVTLSCQNALHGDIGVVANGDAVIALSYSGETAELLEILPHLKRRDVRIVALTGKLDSSLATGSDGVLNVHVETEACPLNLAPTSSTTCMLALGDALAMVLLKARGVDADDFAELHPSGSIGRRLLTRVVDIMRKDAELALVNPGDTINDALAAMTRCKSGAVLAVDDAGKLLGIFTHGDFVRSYQKDRHVADKTVGDCMTQNPIVINGEKLAAEAVNALENNRIDEIVVVDDNARAIGLVDVQDLSRARIF